jgi:hypothetical protein
VAGEEIMSNPTSFRTSFESQITKMPPEHQVVMRNAFNAITDLQGAIPALMSQITTLKTASTTATATATAAAAMVTENITTINNNVSGGTVNNQTGNTTYTTAQGDSGALIILDAATAIALTLNNSVTVPWYCAIGNYGVGTVTATPQQGTLNGSGTILTGYVSYFYYDGMQFWTATFPIVPVNTPAIAHEWINSYNSGTGAFTQAQPAFTDVSGTATTSQIGTGTPSAGKYVDGAAGAWTALPTGLSVTITTAKLTTGGVNGSQTFTGGLLTAQTQAT